MGERRFVIFDSLMEAVKIDPETEGPGRPKTVTIQRAVELTGISVRTINRMIARGREQAAPNKPSAPGAAEQAA